MKKMMIAASAAALAVAALPAFAGGMTEVAPEVAPEAVYVAPMVDNADWSGFGLGVSLGYGSNAFSGGVSTTGTKGGILYGVRGTYDYDMGSWILGAMGTYDFTNIESGSSSPYGTMKKLARVGLRAGADLGDNYLYATGGAAWAINTLVGANETNSGWFIGVGGEHKLNGGWSIGSELISNKFSGLSAGGTLTATTISLFGTYRF